MEFLRSIYEDTFGGGFFDVAPTNNFHVICKCKQNLRISAKVQRCFMLLRDLLSSSDAWCGVPLENRIGHESICCHYKGSRVPLGKSGWLPCHIFHIVICIYEKEHTLLLAFPGPPSSPATAEKKTSHSTGNLWVMCETLSRTAYERLYADPREDQKEIWSNYSNQNCIIVY